MDIIIYIALSYSAALLLFRAVTHSFFVFKLKKEDASEIVKLNIRHYPFVSTASITQFIFLNKHLRFKDEQIVHLGNLLKSYYEKAWVFNAVFPLTLMSVLVMLYWLN
ncbi:MAG: hypothetical protein OEY36_03970 [Gammaproteobacteria bacterium]|nr:hypothetical protein [Gammaproteobacteria bacterium]